MEDTQAKNFFVFLNVKKKGFVIDTEHVPEIH